MEQIQNTKTEPTKGGMMYESLKNLLEPMGWKVEVGKREELESTTPGAPIQCVDGRIDPKVKRINFEGPKIQGGALGIAALIAREEGAKKITKDHLEEGCRRTVKAGYTPGIHDISKDPHCGRMLKSEEVGDAPWEDDFETAAATVASYGGPNVHLDGSHAEQFVGVNFVDDTTRVPNPEQQSFQLDAWFAEKVGIDVRLVLTDAVKTVEALNGPKTVRIWE
ncbi:MAG: cadmium-containing carbonic anhydrase [bacterium]